MTYTVEAIEDGILTTLAADVTLAGYVKQFAPLPDLDEESLKRLLKNFPAIGVVSPSGSYDYAMPAKQDEVGLFLVICFNRNLRSPVAPMRGVIAGEKGLWDLVNDCRRVLLDSKLGLDIAQCLPRRRQLLFAGTGWAAASLEVEVIWRH